LFASFKEKEWLKKRVTADGINYRKKFASQNWLMCKRFDCIFQRTTLVILFEPLRGIL
jgi:hypothetical protein